MIHIECEQGSREWLMAKVGIPSASGAHRIITPATMKLSKSIDAYCDELLAEMILGRPLDDATTEFMQRGTLLEREARQWYEFQRECDVQDVGFLLTDDRRFGCSPDGLVGEDVGLEIKCPSAAVHVGYMRGVAKEKYRCQIQAGLWVTGRKYWDFVSYNPDLPPALVRFERDEEFIAKLAQAVGQFLNYLDTCKIGMQRDYGLFPDFELQPLRVA